MLRCAPVIAAGLLLLATPLAAAECLKPVRDYGYDHGRYAPAHADGPGADSLHKFGGYWSLFDGNDDDDGELESAPAKGTPVWVAHEIRAWKDAPGYRGQDCIPTGERPRPWCTDDGLAQMKIAPTDESYAYPQKYRRSGYDWYVRGYLAMKLLVERMGTDAAWNTHTMLNAVPQRSQFNGGIWLDLEYRTGKWAEKFGKVWVIAGPIYVGGVTTYTIGTDDEFRVAVPLALFKVVVREGDTPTKPEVLAFIYPQVGPGYRKSSNTPYDHTRLLTSVDEIEELTGLDFFPNLSRTEQDAIEKMPARQLWDEGSDVKACRRQ